MNDSCVQEISNLPLRYGAAAAPNQRLGGRGGALLAVGEVARAGEVALMMQGNKHLAIRTKSQRMSSVIYCCKLHYAILHNTRLD